MTEAFICDAVRTPVGRYGGALSTVRADDLAAAPIRALTERKPDVDWRALDDVILGCANQAGEDNRNVARMASLLAGLDASIGGVTVNRLCGSGMEAVGQAARAVMSGESDFLIAGGVESMSRAPFVLPKAETAFSRSLDLQDTTIGWRLINPRMEHTYGVDPLGITAENVAEEHGVSRADQDLFALHSQQKAARAQAAGVFAEEIIPIEARRGRTSVTVASDEHLRPDTTLATLAALKPAFKDGGSVTAGNASGVNDGAAAIVVASRSAVDRLGLTPRGIIRGMATAGVEPRVMGVGPIPAIRKLLTRLGRGISDFDVVELNEAFAAQALAVTRAFDLADDDPRVNPNGGAIALGHPLGMSGARLIITALHQLERTGGGAALCSMCIGVGQGVALVVERVER